MWAEAIYTGGVPVVLGLILIFRDFARDRKPSSGPTETQKRTSISYLGLILIIGGAGLGVVQLLRPSDFGPGNAQEPGRADVIGNDGPGRYQNSYFRFAVTYDKGWENISSDVRKLAVERTKTETPAPFTLLAFRSTNEEAAASLMAMAEPIPKSASSVTARGYLLQTMKQFDQRPDRPRNVREEAKLKIAGVEYDCLSLRRPWGEGEVGMTFWASVQKGYIVIFTATYPSPSGLHAIESLLRNATEFDPGGKEYSTP